ncbi:MAG: thiol-disulfide oxidoreductase DCC [Bacteroidetes bacterium QH_2_64_26]|nr:MAG: thiol-disulfide oxidoreductase DCC [Bacteroidetes bacterium QH_2_64_26]
MSHAASPASEQPEQTDAPEAILLFDGVCNLCNGAVNVLIDADPDAYFRLGTLQSDAARPYLRAFGLDPEAMDSVILIENGQLYTRSTAVLRVARRLDAPWSLLWVFIAVPRPVRDWVYDRVAASRYQWFGRRDTCRTPTPDVRAHFLEDPR